MNTRLAQYVLQRRQKTSPMLQGRVPMSAPVGHTALSEDMAWPKAARTFLTNWVKTPLHLFKSKGHQAPRATDEAADTSTSPLLGRGKEESRPSMADPVTAAFPAGPALALLLSELTNGSEKPRYKMHLYRKGKVKLCDWDLQKRRSVPGGWKHVFVSWFLHFCFFKRKLLKAVW